MYAVEIRKRRKKLGMTQGQIASMLQISRKAYGHFERGVGKLTADQFWLLTSALGMVITEPYDKEESLKLVNIINRLKSIIEYELPRATEKNKKLHDSIK